MNTNTRGGGGAPSSFLHLPRHAWPRLRAAPPRTLPDRAELAGASVMLVTVVTMAFLGSCVGDVPEPATPAAAPRFRFENVGNGDVASWCYVLITDTKTGAEFLRCFDAGVVALPRGATEGGR
jgi:hypothetical protein